MSGSRDDADQMPENISKGVRRRDFLFGVGTTTMVVGVPSGATVPQPKEEMYGEIGKIIAAPGKRDEVIANILDCISNMPGCLSYVVSKDTSNDEAIWISEVWTNKDMHDASLFLPSVKDAIAKGRPLIAGFGDHFVTEPVGGYGLAKGL